MCPKDKYEIEKFNLEELVDDEVEHRRILQVLVEKFAPKTDEAPKGVILMVSGADMGLAHRIRRMAELSHLKVVIADEALEEVEVARSGRRAMVDIGHARITSILAEVLKNMPVVECAPVETYELTAEELTPVAVKYQPKKANSFKQHQNNFKGKGPSTRRVFSQIRPPNRGGSR